jgi:queuine tRNA-ribosyltransferase
MDPDGLKLEIIHEDKHSRARVSRLHTRRGTIDLPTFMPVGTLGTVKGLTIDLVQRTGAQIILGNTYHLSLRPGEDVVAELGGLHAFSGWSGPILTDSGGFQIFSLAKLARISESQAEFRSHIDGRLIQLTPERAIEIQEQLGSDIAMVLDHVAALPSPPSLIEEACARTTRWAQRCLEASRSPTQSLFAIVQGGLSRELRQRSARELRELNFPGYAIGGLSVGEQPQEMYETLDFTCPELPRDKPRYLMGVGTPIDLLESIGRGVDMFDCVMPTRNGRNALAFTDEGPLRLRNLCHQRDPRPLQPDQPSPLDRVSRGYLRHLFMAGEMLGPILLSFHNLWYYQRLMQQARAAILADAFLEFLAERKAGWQPSKP